MFWMLTRLALVTAALCASRVAFADGWSVFEYRDPANAQVVQAARTENGDGFSVTIFRNEDRKVRWVLALPQGSFDRLTEAGRIAAYRVDNSDASSIEVKETRVSDPVLVDGPMVRALLWHGDDASPARGTLRNMLDGETLTVRFFLDDGKTTDTTFAMDGGPDTIAQALGIEVKADPVEVERVQSRDDAILAATSLCMEAADVRQCAGALAKCMGPDANALKAADLKSCMTSVGYRLQ